MGILAAVLGILAIVCAVFATFLFGATGGIIAGVLAVLKRKKDGKGGIAAIVIGGLAIIMAIGLAGTWSNVFSELHRKAVEYKPDGLWAQASENTNGGIMGIISKLPMDEASMDALVEEMNELNELSGAQGS